GVGILRWREAEPGLLQAIPDDVLVGLHGRGVVKPMLARDERGDGAAAVAENKACAALEVERLRRQLRRERARALQHAIERALWQIALELDACGQELQHLRRVCGGQRGSGLEVAQTATRLAGGEPFLGRLPQQLVACGRFALARLLLERLCRLAMLTRL